MQLFPAVIIGGPPDSGKSVLTYHLSQRLRQMGVQHYVLRANPDGEGDWANEADQALVRTILVPRRWTANFVTHVCQSLERRHLPLIVDVGGRPMPWQEAIFDYCSHAILLTPDEAAQQSWQALAERHQLLLLADLRSELRGQDRIDRTSPYLSGALAGLEWGRPVGGPTFEAALAALARLFDYDAAELRRSHLTGAPVEMTVDLDRLARSFNAPFFGEQATWQPGHLPALLDYLPAGRPLGLYGRGPNWLYAAAALRTQPAAFYQFDVRLGWVTPPALRLGPPDVGSPLRCERRQEGQAAVFTFSPIRAYLDYDECQGLAVPPPPPDAAVVIDGKIPHWLTTALALAYRDAPLLAVFQPQAGRVVVRSRLAGFAVGDVLPAPK